MWLCNYKAIVIIFVIIMYREARATHCFQNHIYRIGAIGGGIPCEGVQCYIY